MGMTLIPKVYHEIQNTQERQGGQILSFLPPCWASSSNGCTGMDKVDRGDGRAQMGSGRMGALRLGVWSTLQDQLGKKNKQTNNCLQVKVHEAKHSGGKVKKSDPCLEI